MSLTQILIHLGIKYNFEFFSNLTTRTPLARNIPLFNKNMILNRKCLFKFDVNSRFSGNIEDILAKNTGYKT